MFTGIITDVGKVRTVQPTDGGVRMEITTALDLSDLAIGASVACSGACMTVVEKGADGTDHWFAVEVSGESLSKTTLGSWQPESHINLERALKMGDELGGHLVAGHVDGVATVTDVRPDGDSQRLEIQVSSDLAPYIAAKGSVTIDGVSLTINEVTTDAKGGAVFGLNIIAHTQSETTLGKLAPNAKVNVEIDLLARYVARLLRPEE